MGSCCSLPRARHYRVAEGQFFFLTSPRLRSRSRRFRHTYEFVLQPPAHTARARRAGLQRGFGIRACAPAVGDSAEAMGLCRSLPHAQRSRYNWIAENRFCISLRLRSRSQDSATAMGLCCSLPRTWHSRDRIAGFLTSLRLLSP